MIADEDICEEVFHDAFIKITRKIDQYDESKGRLYTWMVNICRNSAIDKLRSKEISQSTKTETIDHFVFGMTSRSGTLNQVEGIGVKELMEILN